MTSSLPALLPERGNHFLMSARRAGAGLAVFVALAAAGRADGPAASRGTLEDLSLEDLMQVEVTTVSKHREKLTNAPAAVFALNAEDLQRAAVTSLPDALRLVPGMQVNSIDSHTWAISARGFAEGFSNKLLVLQDGRSVYTPLFSGVFWDAQDTMLEDVERVEVVRGPGATLWGANAVNGVINILSKPASETQGTLGDVTFGTNPLYAVRARQGGAWGAHAHYRVYGKYTQYEASHLRTGGRANDDWHNGQVGFRVDQQDGHGNQLTLQGDAYRGREYQTYLLPMVLPPFVTPRSRENRFDGANMLARATRRFAAGSELTVQGYFDYTARDTSIFGETRRTYDLEGQYRFPLPAQEVTLGAGYRSTADHEKRTPYINLTPDRRRIGLSSAFLQDDVAFSRDVHLILGSKVEHNEFTGWEVQPGARMLWTATERHTLWVSAARAVRTPSRGEDDIRLWQSTSTPAVSVISMGDRAFRAEVLGAYEAGWRWHAREKVSVDVTTFVNRYRGLRSTELTPMSVALISQLLNPGRVTAPIRLPAMLVAKPGNAVGGETYGGELAVAVRLASGWRVRASYSRLQIALHRAPTSLDLTAEADEGRSPRNQAVLWSQHDFSAGWKFDWVVRRVDALPAIGIPAYLGADVRLAWRPAPRWEISLAGRDLLDRRHAEFVPSTIITPATEIGRSGQMGIRYEY